MIVAADRLQHLLRLVFGGFSIEIIGGHVKHIAIGADQSFVVIDEGQRTVIKRFLEILLPWIAMAPHRVALAFQIFFDAKKKGPYGLEIFLCCGAKGNHRPLL